MVRLPESKETLWLIITSPTLWAVHFLACYATAAVWCAKLPMLNNALSVVRLLIGVYTVVALAGIAVIGVVAFRHHRFGRATAPHDLPTDEDRHRFLGLAAVLLSGLSAVAVIYVALVALFVESCR